MAVQVDLRQLASRTQGDERPRLVPKNRWAWLTRYVLPLSLVTGFCGTLLYSFREALLPAAPVTVVPVLAVRAEIQQPESPLFQSAGWVEPRPTPVVVSALEEGIVERLFVIEGQELTEGQVVAQLIQTDTELRVRQAEAELKSREAELKSSRAALKAAETRLAEPIELQTKAAEAEAMLARVRTELARLPSQIQAAEARLALARFEQQSRQQSGGAVSKLAMVRADSEVEAATAAVAELKAQRTALEIEQAAQARRVDGLLRQLELKVEEQRQRDESLAAVALGEARVAQAKVALDAAKLSHSRTTVKAPCDGKVLSLVARPGSKVMGLAPVSMPEASTVITMYDPGRLQVRADVRLEDVPRVFPGQKVRIETAAVNGPLVGEVIAATSFTDIQKNTLQVKVGVDDPPPVLKPDMLVQCTFLSPPVVLPAGETDEQVFKLLIGPEHIEMHDGTPRVWIADRQQGVARRRSVVLGGIVFLEGNSAEGLREVQSGLAIGDRLIVGGKELLADGQRIRIVGEVGASNLTLPAAKSEPAAKRMKRL
jgi:multidrug efflux pump subunit AcrA (membrane-fusion protein)